MTDLPLCLMRARKEVLLALGSESAEDERLHRALADRLTAEAVRDIVAMTPGTRPRRVDIDPQGRNVGRINDVTAELQRDYFRRLGVEDLLQPGVEGAGSLSIR